MTYTCNTGYVRTAGSSRRSCQSSGLWSGSHPTCTSESFSILHAKKQNTQLVVSYISLPVQTVHCRVFVHVLKLMVDTQVFLMSGIAEVTLV